MDRAEKRRARRASGVQATHELKTVFLTKECAQDLRAEMAAQGIKSAVSQAEFCGQILEMAVHSMRVQRESKAAQGNLVQPATTQQVTQILSAPATAGKRTPR